MFARRLAWMSVATMALSGACRPVEEAPEDLAELMDRAWFGFHEEDDLELDLMIRSANDLFDIDELLDGYQDGRQNPFTEEHQALVPLGPPDDDDGSWTLPVASAATPLFFLNRYACTIDQLAKVLLHEDQNALYEAYEAYARTYDEPPEAFLSGESDALEWRGLIEAQIPLAGAYSYKFVTGARRVEITGEHVSAGQSALVLRTYSPEPVVWSKDSHNYPQDYQIEIFVPYEGDIVHLYAVWRQMEINNIGDMSGDFVARTTLNTFRQWDDKTEGFCAEGRP
jgi:hypothetical protein